MGNKNRRFSVTFSGVGEDGRHDGKMNVDYYNVIALADADIIQSDESDEDKELTTYLQNGKIEYENWFPAFRQSSKFTNTTPLIMSYIIPNKTYAFNIQE